ncbi:MAG TPA: hypothetical protein VFU40_08205 [Gemmatimonadales bacterium]|nr:hypothetical protein [Gemmatimonadales bacterium]
MANDEVTRPSAGSWALVAIAWVPVLIPLLWGIWQTVKKAAVLFR